MSTGDLGSGPGPAEQVERVLVLLAGLGRRGQQGSGPGEQPESEGRAGRSRAVVQPPECPLGQVPLAGAGGCHHQVGKRPGPDQRGVVGVRRVQAPHGAKVGFRR
ncbi:MAG: hypothetical protein ACJ73E_08370 [Mycobacteriales bacterium]